MDELDDANQDNSDADNLALFVQGSLQTWIGTLAKAIEYMDALDDEIIPPEIAERVMKARQVLARLNSDADYIDWMLRDMSHYMWNLETRRDTADAAYTKGWHARYDKIVAGLTTAEHKHLRKALARIDRKPDVPHV